jgi:hypothetical protein
VNSRQLVLLAALCAAFAVSAAASGGADDPGGGGGGSGGGGTSCRARADLFRAGGARDADATGYVEIRTGSGHERLKVEAEHLDPGAAVEVYVDDGAGTMVPAGPATADSVGTAELEIDAGDGGTLPGGAVVAADLSGRAVEVRDDIGCILLAGEIPAFGGSAAAKTCSLRFQDDDSGASLRIIMKVQGRLGRQEFRMDVRGVDGGSTVLLLIDDGSGLLAEAAAVAASGKGKVQVRLRSRLGHRMPLNVMDLSDLGGRAFEVRANGVTVLSGNLPQLP